MRAGIALVCTIILLPAVHAAATPYLIAYEGDVYPEQAGWERYITGGGVNRSLDNGIFIVPDGMERSFLGSYAEVGFASSGDEGIAWLDTTVFHTYRLDSVDMVDYTMIIDDAVAWEGFFVPGTVNSSIVVFGDRLVGSASGSQWDYFRFGVVPEPGCALLLAVGLFLAPARRPRQGLHL